MTTQSTIELEKTYLLNHLPEDLLEFTSEEYVDTYLPETANHPTLRIRKRGHSYEITKKYPVSQKDSSIQHEFTIKLSLDEYNELESGIMGKRLRKIRYFYKFKGILAEIDVFQDDLEGLIVADFEFNSENEKNNFKMPDFCLIEVTQENFIAGGMLCGKKYNDIVNNLEKFNYKPLYT